MRQFTEWGKKALKFDRMLKKAENEVQKKKDLYHKRKEEQQTKAKK